MVRRKKIKLLIDTREQKPLEFDYPYVTETENIKLDVGDYGCQFEDGYEVPVYFDRKSVPDLFGTIGKGYDRFKREILRAINSNVKLFIIIEGSQTKVLKGPSRATKKIKVKGKTRYIPLTTKEKAKRGVSTVKTLNTLWIRYGVVPIYCVNREDMSRYIYEYYANIGDKRSKGISIAV